MDYRKYYLPKIKKMQQYLEEHELDYAILTRPENVFYFSHFNPVISSWPCYMIISRQDCRLLTFAIRKEHALEEGAIENVQCYGNWGRVESLASDSITAIKKLIGTQPVRVGLEFDFLSIGLQKQLGEALNITYSEDIAKQVSLMKIIKDEYEIECMRKSALLCDAGVARAIEVLGAGGGAATACGEGQYAMNKIWQEQFADCEITGFGSSESACIDSLDMWCLSNRRICFGCDGPKNEKYGQGDILLPQAWARINGYVTENERTLYVGALSGVKHAAYQAMLKSRELAFAQLKPGVTFSSVVEEVKKVFIEFGFGNYLPGRIGHGMGLSAHEFPSVAIDNDMLLEPGMIFTVEPGILDHTWGGVRHSDTVLITKDGYECLTKLAAGDMAL